MARHAALLEVRRHSSAYESQKCHLCHVFPHQLVYTQLVHRETRDNNRQEAQQQQKNERKTRVCCEKQCALRHVTIYSENLQFLAVAFPPPTNMSSSLSRRLGMFILAPLTRRMVEKTHYTARCVEV